MQPKRKRKRKEGKKIQGENATAVKITSTPPIFKFHIPFFVDLQCPITFEEVKGGTII
jgi:hypothetical protein